MKYKLGTPVIIRFTEHYTIPTQFRVRLQASLRVSISPLMWGHLCHLRGRAAMPATSLNNYRNILDAAL